MKTLPIIFILIISGCASWSTHDKMLAVASFGASYADYHTTRDILDNGGYEMNPLIGKHPSNEKLAAYMLTTQLITIAIAHFWEDYRTEILMGKTFINTGCAVHNNGEN